MRQLAWALSLLAIAACPTSDAPAPKAPDRPASAAPAVASEAAPGVAPEAPSADSARPEPPKATTTRWQRLDNGLGYALLPEAGAEEVALVVLYDVGDDHDPPGQSGLGHLIEHLYVTAATPVSERRTAREWMSRYPRGWNAQTGARYTVFATVVDARADLGAEIADAAARMGDLRPTEGDLAQEVPRVQAELSRMYGGPASLAVPNLAADRARPRVSARRGGLRGQLAALSVEAVKARLASVYTPDRARLVVAGAFDPEAVERLVRTHFGPLEGRSEGPPAPATLGEAPAGVELAAARHGPNLVCRAWRLPEVGPEWAQMLLPLARILRNKASYPDDPELHFAPLDRPEVATVCAPLATETLQESLGVLDHGVSEVLRRPVDAADQAFARRVWGPLLGLTDQRLPQYARAFAAGRRAQLGLSPEALSEAWRALDAKGWQATVDALLAQPSAVAAAAPDPF